MNLPEESIGKVMNKEINMKKDPAVELARIFGCLLVVGVHCWINNFGVAIQSKSGTYIACIFADGVAVFWIISGFLCTRTTVISKR